MVRKTDIKELKLLSRGKVRDIYEMGNELLIVTTDRVSAFDYILNQTIPDKGKVLNSIALFFFGKTEDVVENHVIESDFDKLPEELKKYDYLKNRFLIAKKAKPLPVECIVRGYITGSGWKEYKKSHSIGGMHIEQEMVESEKFTEPLFTPSTKADEGHDENISFDRMKDIIGSELAVKVRDITVDIYKRMSEFAYEKGIIIADTKMEFGMIDDRLIIIDELLTPDSSRFWYKDKYEKGKVQESLDKQFIRNYLLSTDWDRNSPPPDLPEDIVKGTSDIYKHIYKLITGNEIS